MTLVDATRIAAGGGAPATRGAFDARRSRRWRTASTPSMRVVERSRNKTATQAKRRNGCNGPGALELRWALGARGALAPKDRERAAALLDDNEGRGLDACPRGSRRVSRGRSGMCWPGTTRPGSPTTRRARRTPGSVGGEGRSSTVPQRAHLNLNQLHNVADAKDDIDPLKRRHLDAPTIEEKPLIDEVPSLVEGKARPPPSTKFFVGEVDVGQRCWVVGSSAKEVAASRRLDLVQLEHAQGTFVEGTYLRPLTDLPYQPYQRRRRRPKRPWNGASSARAARSSEVGSTTHGCRLWYAPRAFETLEGCGPQAERLASGLSQFLPDDGDAERFVRGGSRGLRELRGLRTRGAYREDTRQTDPAAAEELWAAQLAFCAPGEAFASRAFSGDDRIIRSLPGGDVKQNETPDIAATKAGLAARRHEGPQGRAGDAKGLLRLRGRTGRGWEAGRRVLRGAAR